LGSLAEEEGDNIEAAQRFGEALIIFERLKSGKTEEMRRSLDRVKENLPEALKPLTTRDSGVTEDVIRTSSLS
jgi:hypothetical protein